MENKANSYDYHIPRPSIIDGVTVNPSDLNGHTNGGFDRYVVDPTELTRDSVGLNNMELPPQTHEKRLSVIRTTAPLPIPIVKPADGSRQEAFSANGHNKHWVSVLIRYVPIAYGFPI